MVEDFKQPSNPTYKAVHIFFTESCPSEIFNDICKHPIAKRIKTIKEVNIAFLPYESQVNLPFYDREFVSRPTLTQIHPR